MTECLQIHEIEQFVFGSVSVSRRLLLQQHVESCAECAAAVELERLFGSLCEVHRHSFSGCSERASEVSEANFQVNQRPAAVARGYQVLDEVHRGGQGIVYRAVQRATKRTVALKILLGGESATPAQVQRFEREIYIAASLRHRNIVTIYDSGVENGERFLAMEFVNGKRLDKYLSEFFPNLVRQGSTAQVRSVLKIFQQIASAVGYAHVRGIVHRDLKPSNIIVDDAHEPHVLDFGLAKFSGSEFGKAGNSPTVCGEFLGTLAYASPEQTRGDPRLIDVRSDVYSLGVMMYESLTGQLPYRVGNTLSEALSNIAMAQPQAPSSINGRINDELETILLKSLSKEPDRRYQSGEQMARDLAHYLVGEPIDAKRDSNWYMLKKSLQHYRVAVATGVSIVIVICLALAVSIHFWRQTLRQRNVAIQAGQQAEAATAREAELRQEADARRADAELQRREAEYQAYVGNVAAAAGAIQQHDVVEAHVRLNAAPESLRGWEWQRLASELDDSTRTFHAGMKVEHVSLSPDGKLVAASGSENYVMIWETATGNRLAKLDGPARAVVSFDPRGRYLAIGWWNGSIHMWNVRSREFERKLQGPAQGIDELEFSPDGSLIGAAFHQPGQPGALISAVVWRVDDGEQVQSIPVDYWLISDLAFSCDSRTIALARFNGLSLWDIPTGKLQRQFPDLPGHEQCVAFSQDGKLLASGSADNDIRIWDIASGEVVQTVVGHSGSIRGLVFSADGRSIISGSRDKTIRISSLDSDSRAKVLLGHQWTVVDCDLQADGSVLATGSWDQTVKVWALNKKGLREQIDGHSGQIGSIAFAPTTGIFATASWDHTIKLWDAKRRREVATLDGHNAPVHGVTFSHDGKLLASCGWNGQVRLWDAKSRAEIANCIGHDAQSRVHAVAFSLDGKWFVSGASDNTLRCWDTTTGEQIAVLTGHDDHIHAVSISGEGDRIASGGHNSIRIWDSRTRSCLVSIPRKMVQDDYSLAFHPNGQSLVAGSQIGELTMWNVADGKPLRKFTGHTDEIHSVAFHPNGSRLASAAFDGKVKIWEADTGRQLATLSYLPSPATTIAFSPDCKYLVAGLQNGQIHIWESKP